MRVLFLASLAFACHGASGVAPRRLDLTFEQVSRDRYVARGQGYLASLEPSQAAITVESGDKRRAQIRMRWQGASRRAQLAAEQPLAGRIHYFTGRDAAAWRTGVTGYRRVRYRGVYPGVDLVFYGREDRTFEYDFVVAPGADPARIRLAIDGASSLRIDQAGDLVLATAAGDLRWRKPTVYQDDGATRSMIDGRFAIDRDGAVRFEVARWDRARTLVIDPTLSYSTYLGGLGNEGARVAQVDAAGNVYLAGVTTSQDLPVTRAAQPQYGGHTLSLITGDAFVAKFDTNGALVYLTYLGGARDDFASGLAVDAQGNAWVAGGTSSLDFPVTSGAVQPKFAGAGGSGGIFSLGDGFLARIGPNGGTLLYSTYFGGALDDFATAIATDGSGNVYLTGATISTDFPTRNPLQAAYKGRGGEQVFPRYNKVPFEAGDVWVAKFSNTQQLIYSTYLGGALDEMSTAIAADSAGNAYVAGYTLSTDFPTTAGAFQRSNKGSNVVENIFWNFGDGFVSKINPTGSALVYSTYLGGGGDDFVSSLLVDSTGAAYVTGSTCSIDFPTTTGVAQTRFKGPFNAPEADLLIGDAFVSKLNPQGAGLAFSTLFGGNNDDAAMALTLDAQGNIFVAGFTNSTDFPVTGDAYQKTYGGGGLLNEHQNYGDAFLLQLNPQATQILYATYLGGSADDEGMAVAVDASGNAWLAGAALSRNFPTNRPLQTTFGGASGTGRYQGDIFLARISGFPTAPAPPSTPDPNPTPTPQPPAANTPVISSVVNAASYAAGVVSPGMIFTAFGTLIGPDALTGAALAADGRVSGQVAETQFLFDGVAAPIVYVSAKQSSAIAPYAVAGKTSTQVVAVYKGQRSAPLSLRVADAAPGLFSANSSGSGPGAILNQNGALNSASNPAAAGEIVVLYGTGEGQTQPGGRDGAIASETYPAPALPVAVTIGGRTAEVVYAGAVPYVVAGEFQINAKVPSGLTAGSQPVVVSFGAFRSQANLTLAVR
jgi:uncharacterized protein (TIGR03437 family)